MAWISVHDNVIGKKLRELTKELGRSQLSNLCWGRSITQVLDGTTFRDIFDILLTFY